MSTAARTEPDRAQPTTEALARAAAADQTALAGMLGVDLTGLSGDEAARRRSQYGLNAISLETRSIGTIVRGQISGINVLLGLAGVLTWATGDTVDGVIILALIAINVGLSIFQEYRAEQALRALRALLPFRPRVWRDGAVSPSGCSAKQRRPVCPNACRRADVAQRLLASGASPN